MQQISYPSQMLLGFFQSFTSQILTMNAKTLPKKSEHKVLYVKGWKMAHKNAGSASSIFHHWISRASPVIETPTRTLAWSMTRCMTLQCHKSDKLEPNTNMSQWNTAKTPQYLHTIFLQEIWQFWWVPCYVKICKWAARTGAIAHSGIAEARGERTKAVSKE